MDDIKGFPYPLGAPYPHRIAHGPNNASSLCILLVLRSLGRPEAFEERNSSDLLSTCNQIAKAVSGASQVLFPPSPEYLIDISHVSAASSQASTCSVEPGSAEDVSKILRILGSTRILFAVKGGGHTMNPGFSSTNGVQIVMTRFNETKVNSESTWARAPTVGVAGFTLGGGHTYTTSQYGLTIDNVAGYELVPPNGTVLSVTSKDEDLWFGLRGGMNNFVRVPELRPNPILKSYPQSDIWGGFLFYSEDQLDAIKMALLNFQEKNDTKAAVLVFMAYSSGPLVVAVELYYDVLNPSRVFDEFLRIPTITGNVSTSSFSDFVKSVGPQIDYKGLRVFCEDAPTKFWEAHVYAQDEHVVLTSILEPFKFDKGIFSHGSDSAYLPNRSQVVFPSALIAQWSNASLDDAMTFALRNISNTIHSAPPAARDGQKWKRGEASQDQGGD
ncbi:hypothetical protein F5888DRAFT_1806711 [Russula emetica]|nr:hypothetical protein F5888DRAFT_1806711 [Russula emetica]